MELLLQQLLNGLVLASNYSLFALGLSVVWGVLKVLNLAHAELFTLGALAAVLAANGLGAPIWLALPIAALAGGVLGVLVDWLAFRPLRARNLGVAEFELSSLITSIGASTILISVATRVTGNHIETFPPGFFGIEPWRVGGLIVTNAQIMVTAVSITLTLGTWLVVEKTQFGRALRSLAYSPEMSQVFGIRTEFVYRTTLFACGAFAAVAGVLLTIMVGTIDAYSGANLMLKAIAIIVLAGAGSIPGVIVGAVILGVGETVGPMVLPPAVESSLPFLIILVVLLISPNGLFGRAQRIRT